MHRLQEKKALSFLCLPVRQDVRRGGVGGGGGSRRCMLPASATELTGEPYSSCLGSFSPSNPFRRSEYTVKAHVHPSASQDRRPPH